jgi:hypothetical protein
MRTRRIVQRNRGGFQLVESLVAIIIGTFYCLALVQMSVETMRVSTTSANKQDADLIAQTVLDAYKAAQTNSGTALPYGSFDLVANPTSPGQTASGGHFLPVGIDQQDMSWIGSVNKFPGTVNLTVTPGPDPSVESQTITVTVSWSDGQVVNKSIATMTVTHPRGISLWQ